jgi:hypothetical protein
MQVSWLFYDIRRLYRGFALNLNQNSQPSISKLLIFLHAFG